VRRLFSCLLLSLAAAAGVYAALRSAYPPHTDWDQIYFGARAFLTGADPYGTVRHDQYPSFYPATAFLVAAPFVWLPFLWAKVAWVGVGTWAFVTAMTRRGWWGLLALASSPFLNAVLLQQWSPLLVGGTALPWLSVAWAGKPTLGAALFIAYPSRRAAWLGLGVVLLSLAFSPDWPARWLATVQPGLHLPPIVRPGGALLLLGLLRWRRPEGRLLAGLSLVPQISMAYELVPLLLIPRSAREMATLVVLSQIAFAVAVTLPGIDPMNDLAGTLAKQWPVWLVGVYLPALALILRPTSSRGPESSVDRHPQVGNA
jgi:hypothetical protein